MTQQKVISEKFMKCANKIVHLIIYNFFQTSTRTVINASRLRFDPKYFFKHGLLLGMRQMMAKNSQGQGVKTL